MLISGFALPGVYYSCITQIYQAAANENLKPNKAYKPIFHQINATLNKQNKICFYQDRALTDFSEKEIYYLHVLNLIDWLLITTDQNLRFIMYYLSQSDFSHELEEENKFPCLLRL